MSGLLSEWGNGTPCFEKAAWLQVKICSRHRTRRRLLSNVSYTLDQVVLLGAARPKLLWLHELIMDIAEIYSEVWTFPLHRTAVSKVLSSALLNDFSIAVDVSLSIVVLHFVFLQSSLYAAIQ